MTPNDMLLKLSDKLYDEKYDDKVLEKLKTEKHGLLKKCDEINKQNNNDSFISNIEFGLNDKIKY